MLTVPQAERLSGLAVDHFIRQGRRTTVGGGIVVHEDGRQNPLTSLAHRCRDIAEEHWPAVVEEYFRRLDSVGRGGEDAEGLLRNTYLRLLPDDALADIADGFRYVRPVSEGLLAALALDAPETVRILGDADVASAGAEELWAAGRANVLAEAVEYEAMNGPSGAALHSVYGDSHFVAAKALVLPELVRELTGRELPENGALVVVPTRHLLAFHPIVDGTVVDAVNELGAYALRAYQDGPGSLSPRLYWWHQGRLVCLTAFDHETRSMSVVPPQELMDLMKRLRGGQSVKEESPFAVALAGAYDACAADPDAERSETWRAWVAAMQAGSALFEGGAAQPYADARAWLDAFWLALVCREGERLTRLSQVPLEDLRRVTPDTDDYLFHWIDTLQTYCLRRPTDELVPKLLATMKTSSPDVATRTDKYFLDLVDYPPVAVFHRVVTNEHEAFAQQLSDVLRYHETYWSGSTDDPRSRVALGPLAIACLAHDARFPVDTGSPYLPKYLLNGAWYGEFPT